MTTERSSFGRVYRRKRSGKLAPGYYVRVRIHGREVTRWAGPDRRTATQFLGELLRKSAREDLLGEKVVADVTFRKFLPKLLAYFEAHHSPTTLRGERGCLNRIAEHFGDRTLGSISRNDIQDFLDGLHADRNRRDGETVTKNPPASRATKNRYASTLSVAFRLAVERGYATSSPVVGIRRQREPEHPVPFMSAADVDQLIAPVTDPLFGALLRILADCGMRRSEALRLEWKDIQLTRSAIVIRKSKTRRPRDIPLTAKARAAFELLHAARRPTSNATNDFVWPHFQRRMDAVEARFRRLRVRAGFPTMRLSDLRHGFCSRLAQEGVPIPTISTLAGHRSITTTMRYASHLPTGATVDAIRKLDAPSEPET